jgi:cytochrome c5
MDAYHGGLTGDAAAWAVRKQKGHRTVSEHAMIALEAVVQNQQ